MNKEKIIENLNEIKKKIKEIEIELNIWGQLIEYGKKEINEVLEAIKEINWGILDNTIKENRNYWKLLVNKIEQITWFKKEPWNYWKLIILLYKNSDNYQKYHFRNIKNLYYNIWWIISILKIKQNEKKISDI
jgi:hypothetical protein